MSKVEQDIFTCISLGIFFLLMMIIIYLKLSEIYDKYMNLFPLNRQIYCKVCREDLNFNYSKLTKLQKEILKSGIQKGYILREVGNLITFYPENEENINFSSNAYILINKRNTFLWLKFVKYFSVIEKKA